MLALPRQIGSDDVVYCFVLDDGDARTLLTINIVDEKVHLETWTERNISADILIKASIDDLLIKLGEKSF